MVVDPFGSLLWEGNQQETIQVVEIDLEQTNHYRNHWPFFRDRRLDTYDEITKRFID